MDDTERIKFEAVQKVLHYIHNNLDTDLSLKTLSEIAHYSPYYFHRIFKTITGESLKSYVQRTRLENSAFDLKVSKKPVIDLAFDSGYTTHESFTRAFKDLFNKPPKDYRKHANSDKKMARQAGQLSQPGFLGDISVLYFEGLRCAFVKHIGSYLDEACSEPMKEGSLWTDLLKELSFTDSELKEVKLLGICHDDPQITPEGKIRYDVCVSLPPDYKAPETILIQDIPEGFYIKAAHTGRIEHLGTSYDYLLWEWSKAHEKTVKNLPPFEEYRYVWDKGNFFLHCVDIYIPVR